MSEGDQREPKEHHKKKTDWVRIIGKNKKNIPKEENQKKQERKGWAKMIGENQENIITKEDKMGKNDFKRTKRRNFQKKRTKKRKQEKKE